MKRILLYFLGFIIGCLIVMLISCSGEKPVFTKYEDIAEHHWDYDDILSYTPEINDTTINYDVVLYIRHQTDYAYQNLWLKVFTTFPSGKRIENQINLKLADHTGKWIGKGRGGLRTAPFYLQQSAIFPEVGQYEFELQQNMRVNPLEHVVSVGLEVMPSATSPTN